MNLIKRQNPVFTSLIDDLFINQDWNHISATVPAANIIEADDHFDIELAAPGKKKSDFTIELDEGVLTISSETETKSTEKKAALPVRNLATALLKDHSTFLKPYLLIRSVRKLQRRDFDGQSSQKSRGLAST